MRWIGGIAVVVMAAACAAGQPAADATPVLPPAPPALQAKAEASVAAAATFDRHVWRDTPPLNADGTINGYIEIPRGESTKWEFRIPLNRREIDREIPRELGGYPINYGFMPQTISYDGDPADVLVLGPPLAGGEVVTGAVVALMRMTDTGDLDDKVIISPLDAQGRPTHTLESADRVRLTRFFDAYKQHEGKATKITGFADAAAAREFLRVTSGFFAAARRR